MKLLQRLGTVIRHPRIVPAYLQWCAWKSVGREPRPRFRDQPNQTREAAIGEWLSFSEFWTYRDLIPWSEEALLLEALSRPDRQPGLAIDIGANLGIFACRAASLGHRVHAFEPMPDTFARLEKNLLHNGLGDLVRANLIGIGDEEGFAEFERPEKSPGQSRMTLSGGPDVTRVPLTTLDRYLEKESIGFIDFLKIDVEGMETRVLRGGRRAFQEKRIGTALIEVCPWNLRHAGTSPDELFGEIDSLGYGGWRLEEDGTPGEPWQEIDLCKIHLENFVLRPKSSVKGGASV
jgi:FkbM family methyltransferase